jgi:hypothetical protein
LINNHDREKIYEKTCHTGLESIMVNSERHNIARAIRIRYKSRKLPIEFYQEVAEAFEGKCLSEACADTNDELEFQCKRNHVWKAVGATIALGHWCGKCQRLELAEKRRWTLEICREIAKSKGGRCLSTEYIDSNTPMEWECNLGHRWFRKAKYIKTHWCATCAKLRI